MYLHIVPSDSVPIYQQIVQQIRTLVAAGRLAPGEELPAIRVLDEQLQVNFNTVARAAYARVGFAEVGTFATVLLD